MKTQLEELDEQKARISALVGATIAHDLRGPGVVAGVVRHSEPHVLRVKFNRSGEYGEAKAGYYTLIKGHGKRSALGKGAVSR